MSTVNFKRVAIGALAGSAVWSVWTSIVTMTVLMPTYASEQKLGHILTMPRYGFKVFFGSWLLMLLIVTGLSGYTYARIRQSSGPGFKNALAVGLTLGLIASVPANLSVLTWAPMSDSIPFTWMLDTWIGITLATCVAALVYTERK